MLQASFLVQCAMIVLAGWATLVPGSASAATIFATADQSVVRIDDGTRAVDVVLGPLTGRGLLGSATPSPDGSAVAYIWAPDPVDGDDPPAELRLAPLDGSPTRTLFKGEMGSAPAWSPDGQRILFGRIRRTETSYHVDAWETSRTGDTPRKLLVDAMDAKYSPDGTRLAFTRLTWTEADFDARVIVRDLLTGVTQEVGDGFQPAWSPDGSRLAYASWRDRFGEDCRGENCSYATELYVADLATGAERRITHTKGVEEGPSWSPDGERIAVSARRETRGVDGEIWTFSATSDCAVQLTWMGPSVGETTYVADSVGSAGPACGTRPDYLPPDATEAGARMLYPGPRYRGKLLSDVFRGVLSYLECDLPVRECRGELRLIHDSICERSPADFGSAGKPSRPAHVWKRRGAIIAAWPRSDGFEVYTGSDTLAVYDLPARLARDFVDRLRPVTQNTAKGKLPSPRLTRRDLAVIRNTPELRPIARRLPAHVERPSCSPT